MVLPDHHSLQFEIGAESAGGVAPDQYEVVSGYLPRSVISATIHRVLGSEATEAGQAGNFENDTCRVDLRSGGIWLHAQGSTPVGPATLDSAATSDDFRQVLIMAEGRDSLTRGLFSSLVRELRLAAACYTSGEIKEIVAAMPLVDRYAVSTGAFGGWSLIFRDHYVENSVGFLLGMERAGMEPEWIFALSKGDRTLSRGRVHSWFLHRGYRSDILDNSVINGSANRDERARALAVNDRVDEFISNSHAAGRRVLVIDDGGLLAQGYGARDVRDASVDGALELTVSGLKRVAAAPGGLAVPVMNMARSQLKTMLGYNEIADSCVRRLRAIIPGQKFIGRHVLLLGFGTLGGRVAHALRALGCRVSIVDTGILALINAAEQGYETYRTLNEALRSHEPFLIIGNTGEPALQAEDLPLLPDGVFLAGFATKDFSLLSEGGAGTISAVAPGVGVSYRLPSGASATLLGDGRSLNLFEYEGIANRGYDAYRAGTLIAARALCERAGELAAGVHLEAVDRAIEEAGLFEAYYEQYLAPGTRRFSTMRAEASPPPIVSAKGSPQ
ncbi:hypothetical protein [Streptomyces niveus]|uniref:hypothetical protein n=1 Tax=Streptomyces niveus TaxID=193462 RepID=UPI0035D73E04